MKTNILRIPYGTSSLSLSFDDDVRFLSINPNPLPPIDNQIETVNRALNNPLDEIQLEKIRQAKHIGIAINDQTRPVPHQILLPQLIEYLKKLSVKEQRITFFIATGTHAPLKSNEFYLTVPGNLCREHEICCHDCDNSENLQYFGETTKKTPIWINKEYTKCDVRISVGDIEPHHFMGYSGGAKSIVIGLAGRETITANHKWLLHENSRSGIYAGNLIREDVEEMGDMVGIDACLNAVLTPEKEIAYAFWGTPRTVMKMGISFVDRMYMVRVGQKFDTVIASAGGYPKDINLYQAQKALTHACMIANPGAMIILLAACKDGMGSTGFDKFLFESRSLSDVIQKFLNMPFTIGPHKAYQLALQAEKFQIFLFSQIESEFLSRRHITPLSDIEAIQKLINHKKNKPIAIIPYATHTIPIVV